MKRPRRKICVTLHMRSGACHRVVCNDVTIEKERGNTLRNISLKGGILPFYVRLDAIDTITVRPSWRHWVML